MRPVRAEYQQGTKTPYKKNSGSSGSQSSDKKLQDPVEVYCRLRPCHDSYPCISIQSPTILTLNAYKNRKEISYGFNHIFTEHADQKEIFDHIAVPLLNSLLLGENGLLFAYGITSAGKTYTMMGEQDNPGIIPRSVNILFNTIQQCQTPKFLVKSDRLNGFEIQDEGEALTDRLLEAKQKRKQYVARNDIKHQFSNDGTVLEHMDSNLFYAVFITYVEIYNNSVYDLLDESPGQKVLQSKILREDQNHNVYVNNAVEVEAKTSEEALELFNLGSKRKRMAHTTLNNDSSRSHSIFTIRLVITNTDGSSNSPRDKINFMVSQLSLVDLAGSERCSRSQTTGQRLKEAGRINNSLLTLRTCLEILRENQQSDTQRMVPYRESRLTHLFKNYFEGEGKVKMIVCVNPSIKDYDENLFVLKFAEITQDVKVFRRPEVKLIETPAVSDAFSEEEFLQIRSHRPSRSTLPRVRLINPDSDEITSLIIYMKRRQQTMTNFKKIRTLSDKFRLRLSTLQKEKDDFQRQVEHQLPAERERVKSLKNKVLDLGYEHDKVVKKCEEKDETISELQKIIAQKELEIRQGVFEKVKQKRKIEEVSEKMTHELDAKLRHQRNYLTAQMKEQNEKLELVKDIVSNGTPQDKMSKKSVKSLASILSSKMDVHSILSPSVLTDGGAQMEMEPDPSQAHLPRRDAPVANKRYRRSRSAGDVWVEHRPAMPTPLGTVLQPVINRRKSLTKLTKKKEICNPKQSKYLLISQNQDHDGDLETKLYKADIIPTCSGGAQVIFDDVERLKQESPVKCDSAKKKRMEH